MADVKITLRKGLVGSTDRQKGTIATLGLRKIRQSVTRPDSPSLRGALRSVLHLIEVEEVSS